MANDVIYINASTPIIDQNSPDMVNKEWFRFFNRLGIKANILDGNITLSATAGVANTLPATPEGYMTIFLKGSTYKVPYYK